ncbi:MAG TPA: LPS export ABC transporter periplasmic protein LptC [Abditibacteriaceae bacterium]|jgi:hypothetical protein
METRRNYFSIFAGIFLLLIGAVTYFTLRRSPEEIAQEQLKTTAKRVERKAQDKLTESLGDATFEGGELSGNDNQGRPLWTIGAEKIESQSEEGSELKATLTGAHATLYREGVPETTFRSGKMQLTRDANEKVHLTLSGGVTAKTAAQAIAQAAKSAKRPLRSASFGTVQMQARSAEIDVTARRLVAKNGVTLTQGEGARTVKLTAPRLTADIGLANAQLSGGIKATVPQGNFAAPSALWNWKEHRLSASGGVTAIHENTTLSGARLDADTSGKIGTISGDVRIKAPQGQAHAGSVSYNWGTGRLNARGGVTLTKNNGSLRAGSIECDDKLQNAVARGDVTLQSEGVRLTAQSVSASQGFSRAGANGGVTISKEDVTLRATRIDSWDNFARAEALGAVHLTKGNTSLRAGQATVFNRGTRAVASGGVTLVQGNLLLKANRAQASNLNQKGALQVSANGGITFKQNDLTVSAGRVEATNADSETKRRIVASGGVRAQNARGVVHAARVTWGGGKIEARGGVRARRSDLHLSADKFDGDDKGHQAVLTGHVQVKHANGATLQAPSARYDKASNKVFASGGVVYKDGRGSVMRGQSLVANLNLEQAEITNVKGTISMPALKGKELF